MSSGLGGEIIRVVRAPKLETLGLLSPSIFGIEIANLVFQVAASASRLLLGILTILDIILLSIVFSRD